MTLTVTGTVTDAAGKVVGDFTAPLIPPPPPTLLGHWRNRPADTGQTWYQRHAAAEAQFGPFAGHWRDYLPTGNSGKLTAGHRQALADGKGVFCNWKPWSTNWAQVASGARDAVIVAAAQDWGSVTGQRRITFGHEPENDIPALGTAADHKAMFQRCSDLFREYALDVEVVWTVMGFDPAPLPALWPGAEYVDLLGHDPYVTSTENPAALANKIVDRSSWLRANLPGAADLPVVCPEYGTDLSGGRGTDAHRAAAIDGVRARLDDIAAAGVAELDYFDARTNGFSDAGVDAAAYQALKTATGG